MPILSATDQHPVYLNSLGQPLSYGKLTFKAINSTNLKTIYTDLARTVASPNPIILDQAGRTPTQIFYGDGQYDVYAEQFNGIDPNVAPPTDWSPDNQWKVDNNSTSNTTTSSFLTDTIASLRNVNPVVNPVSTVLGYYAKGDSFDRTYIWRVGGVSIDNGGTLIAHTGDSTGVWELQHSEPSMDVRIWGIFPNSTDTNNSQLTSLATYMQGLTGASSKIFFPKGFYTVSRGSVLFYSPVEFDQGVTIKNNDTVIFTFNVANTFTNPNYTPLSNINSVSNVVLNLNSPDASREQIKVVWWTKAYGGGIISAVTSADFELMLANINSKRYTVLCTNAGAYGFNFFNTADIHFNQKFIFEPNAYIALNSGTGKLYLDEGTEFVNTVGFALMRGDSFTNDYSKLKLSGIKTFNTSWILDTPESLTPSSQTQDLGKTLTTLQAGATSPTTIIYDAPISLFSTPFVDGNSLRHEYASGLLMTSFVATAGNAVTISGLSNWNKGCLNGYFIISNSDTHFDMFWRSGTTNNAWYRACNSAFRGNGVLDLNNRTITVTSSTAIGYYGAIFASVVIIRNGTISATATPILLGGGVCVLELNNVACTVSGDITMVSVQGGYINAWVLNNSYVSAGSGKLIELLSGSIDELRVENSFVYIKEISNDYLTTNAYFNYSSINMAGTGGMCRLDLSSVKAIGTTFRGNSAQYWFGELNSNPSIITGCTFQGTRLLLRGLGDSEITWSSVVTGCVFSGDALDIAIEFQGNGSNGLFRGATITGNTFLPTGDHSGNPKAMVSVYAGFTQSTTPAFNLVNISGNTLGGGLLSGAYLPQTRGVFYAKLLTGSPIGLQYTSFDLTDFHNKKQIFFIDSAITRLAMSGGLIDTYMGAINPGYQNFITSATHTQLSPYVYRVNYVSNSTFPVNTAIYAYINASFFSE